MSGTRPQVEAVLRRLEALWDSQTEDVPEWAAQELTFSQLRLLFLLNRHGPIPVGRIATLLGVGLPAASGVVDRVERHGLVERRHSTDDRRIVECRLTDEGTRLLDDIFHTRAESMRSILDVLDPDELSQLDRLLVAVIERTTPREASGAIPAQACCSPEGEPQ